MASVLDLDPRWRALMAQGGVMDIGFDHPSEWPHAAREDQFFVKSGDDQLTAELCRFGPDRFVKATLTLPIRGADDSVGIAFWVQVPDATFYTYLDTFEEGAAPAPTLAGLANDLASLAEQDAPVQLDFGDGSERPTAALDGGATDISLDQLIDLYEASGTLRRADLKA